MYTEALYIEKLFYRLLAVGQKGLEFLQLSLAAVQVCSPALGLLGRGREGHWAVGRAPRGGDPPQDTQLLEEGASL